MSYFDVKLITTNTEWVLDSLDYVHVLRTFVNDNVLIMQMCEARRRDHNTVWFLQVANKTLDMYHVPVAGYSNKLIDGDSSIMVSCLRAYEAYFAMTGIVAPTMVTDLNARDVDALLGRLGITAKSRRLIGFRKPMNKLKGDGIYNLLFSTNINIGINDTSDNSTTVKTGCDKGLVLKYKSDMFDNTITINGKHFGLTSNVCLPRKGIHELAANKDILSIMKINNLY